MPYGISNTQSDCSGWATVKRTSSGTYETIACHDTKQDAIDQMVAVSMSEKTESIGDVSRRSRDDEVVVVDLDETMVTKSRYPIADVVRAVNRLSHRVFVVTGREEAQREQTLDDLDHAGIGYDELFMMPEVGQDIAAYKRDTVSELMHSYDVIAFVDDNDDNRDAVESLGVYVMTPGEFIDAARESGLFDDDEDESEPDDESESEFEIREGESRYDSSQPRDENGQWTSTGGGGFSGDTAGGGESTAAPSVAPKSKTKPKVGTIEAQQQARQTLPASTRKVDANTVKLQKDNIEPAEKGQMGDVAQWQVVDIDGNHVGHIKQVRESTPIYAGTPRMRTTYYAKPRAHITRRPKNNAEIDKHMAIEKSDGSGTKDGALSMLINKHNRIIDINNTPDTNALVPLDSELRYDPSQPRGEDGKWSSGGGSSVVIDEDIEQAAYADSDMYTDVASSSLTVEQQQHLSSLDESTSRAISDYAVGGHLGTNTALRGAPPPPLSSDDAKAALDRGEKVNAAIRGAPPLESGVIVYRSVDTRVLGARSAADIDKTVGSSFIDKGITSTSISRSIASEHAAASDSGSAITMEIRVPAASKALYIEPLVSRDMTPGFAAVGGEFEVLLPSNTRYKIVGVRDGMAVVDVVPGEGRGAPLEGELRYDPLQPRAPDGKWTSGGGGFSSSDINTGESGSTAAGGGGATGGSSDTPRAPRPGMGDIPLDADTVAAMRGGSAEKHLVTMPDGTVQFTPERQALHDRIVRNTVEGVPASANPTMHMMGGGAAAGKSTMVRSGAVEVPGEGKAVQLNVDETRKQIPEYAPMLAAGDKSAGAFTHEEASFVTKRAQQAAFERKQDVVLDGVGDSSEKGLTTKIETAQKNGYKVNGYYATVPVATAIERSDARGNNPNSPDFGRFVPHEVIKGQHASVARVLPAVAPKFDSVVLYDTSSGSTPRLLMRGGGGSITVVDQAGFDAFKAIGGG